MELAHLQNFHKKAQQFFGQLRFLQCRWLENHPINACNTVISEDTKRFFIKYFNKTILVCMTQNKYSRTWG